MNFNDAMAAAAHIAEAAVAETMHNYGAGHLTDEDDITPDLLATLRTRLDGQIGGLTWKSSVVRHRRGTAAEEAKIGADRVICVTLNTPTDKYSKGVLVQAKRIGPDVDMNTVGLAELKLQCSKMLSLTPSAFVFDYVPGGMRVGSANRIAGTSEKNLYALCSWTPYRFFLELSGSLNYANRPI